MSHPLNEGACVAIVGGAAAGAEAAARLAEGGATCVVFEQNDRPYGKVEDGLPRWHVGLRRKEYDQIDSKLRHERVHFVPRTAIGRDLAFADLEGGWDFDVIVLANGAWRDRPLPVDGAERWIDRGLVYQNSLIYWFNHCQQPDYRGPVYEPADDALVVGGGLASIDVAKLLQIRAVQRRLAERGIEVDVVDVEADGIPDLLAKHGLDWGQLGLWCCTVYYRRRLEDMPLAEIPEGADPEQVSKIETVRRRILEKAQAKFLFRVEPLCTPVGLIDDGERLVGLRLARTRLDERGRAVVLPGAEKRLLSNFIVSSIGSIPEPIEGLPMQGELLKLADPENARLDGLGNVYGCGNVVTGKGNLVASRKHSQKIAGYLTKRGLAAREGGDPDRAARNAKLLERVRERQRAVGYDGDYPTWIRTHTPEGFV
ncbi:MAG: FAD-dependent oxidoreductase [Alphaproteobacteria bacterium]